ISIAENIASGSGGTNIHLGTGKGLLGVEVSDGQNSNSNGSSGGLTDPFGNSDGSSGGLTDPFGNSDGRSGALTDPCGNRDGSSGGLTDPFGNSNGSSSQLGNGAYVQSVQSGSAADQAGIQQGDVITAVDGHSVTSVSDLSDAMSQHNPHDHVRVDWTDAN